MLGEKAYPDLDAIPKDVKIDIVNIFRRSEEVPEVVDAAIRLGVPAIWMQEGVINDDAAAKARAAGNICGDGSMSVEGSPAIDALDN